MYNSSSEYVVQVVWYINCFMNTLQELCCRNPIRCLLQGLLVTLLLDAHVLPVRDQQVWFIIIHTSSF